MLTERLASRMSSSSPPINPGDARPFIASPVARALLHSMLMPGEKVVRVATISPAIYWKSIAVFIIALLTIIFVAPPLGLFLLFVSFVLFGFAHMTKYFLMLAATDKRVLVRFGIFNVEVIQMRYSKIESVELFWSLPGQLLNYSTVIITGTGNRVAFVPFIADGPEFRRILSEILIRRDEIQEHDEE